MNNDILTEVYLVVSDSSVKISSYRQVTLACTTRACPLPQSPHQLHAYRLGLRLFDFQGIFLFFIQFIQNIKFVTRACIKCAQNEREAVSHDF